MGTFLFFSSLIRCHRCRHIDRLHNPQHITLWRALSVGITHDRRLDLRVPLRIVHQDVFVIRKRV